MRRFIRVFWQFILSKGDSTYLVLAFFGGSATFGSSNKTKETMSSKLLYAFLLVMTIYAPAGAQVPGSLDLSFDHDGIKITPIGTANAFGRSMVVQPDGRIIVACIASNGTNPDFVIARFTTDGELDTSLDGDGIVMTDFDEMSEIADAIALDEFNRIIVGGYIDHGLGFGFAVTRYLSDGTLDETFGDSGLVTKMIGKTGFCKSLAVQKDNKIVLGGYVLDPISNTNEFMLMRFNTDGTPDSTFHEDGIVQTNTGIGAAVANAILIQPDKKIVLAGQVLNNATLRWQIGIARYNEDGSIDDTWDQDGLVFTGLDQADFTINAVLMDANKKIVVGGYFGTAPSTNLFAVARYHLDGRLDETFGDEGIQLGSFGDQGNEVNTLAIQPDGQILIAGTSLQGNRDKFAIARLDPDGAFDDSFGEQGVVRPVIEQNDGINAMALQQDGKLVVAGESFNGQRFSIAVARIETGLTTRVVDPTPSVINISIVPNPIVENFTLSYQLKQSGPVQIALYDVSGSMINVFSDKVFQASGEYQEGFEIPEGISAGLYWLVVNAGEQAKATKVIVSRG